jgi:hypothetical protein
MYLTYLTQQTAGRSRRFAAMVGAALTLVLAAAHVETAAAYTSFADNITVSGVARCVSYGSTQYSISLMSSPTNPSYWYPYPATSYAVLKLVNTSTNPNTKVWETGWMPFSGVRTITLGTPGTGRFIVQAAYGRFVGNVFSTSTNWETIGVLNYPWGNICF